MLWRILRTERAWYPIFWFEKKGKLQHKTVTKMSEFKPIILGFGNGLKDSILGMTAIFRIDHAIEQKYEEKQKKMAEFQRHRGMRARPKQESPESYEYINLMYFLSFYLQIPCYFLNYIIY